MNDPVALIQALYADFGRGDLPAILARLTDDVSWTFHGTIGLPYMRTARGPAEVARWFGQVAEADGIQAFEPREFFAGPDHVTVLGWERTQALPAGRVFETEWVHLWSLRGGKVARFVGMFDTAAVAAARA
jgi:ketosteroid isomerase-like protein